MVGRRPRGAKAKKFVDYRERPAGSGTSRAPFPFNFVGHENG